MHPIAWWSSLVVLTAASGIDICTRRIPNWLSLPYLAGGVLAQGIEMGWPGVATSLAGAALACLLFAPGCYLRFMGMGDLKLAAAVGAWIGPEQFLLAFIVTGVAGGLMAVTYTRKGRSTLRAAAIPYAPAIAAGALFAFLAR